MKILFISYTSDVTHGWGRYTHDFAEALRTRGHEVVIINEWLQAHAMRSLHHPFSYLRIGVWPRDVFLLRAAIKEFRPDIIHVSVESYMLLLPFLPLRGIGVFMLMAGTYSYLPALVGRPLQPLYRLLSAQAVRRINAAFTVSAHTRMKYLERAKGDPGAFPPERLRVLPTGIVLSEFATAVREVSPSRPVTIITVGAVKSRKGFLQIVRALGYYKRTFGASFKYYIIGATTESDEYVEKVRRAIQEEGIEEQVEFVGQCSNEMLQQMYANADVFIMLPIDGRQFEGFGVVYLEANAYGVPTIGARNTAAAEAVRDGFSGLLGDPSNPKEIAELIDKVVHGDIKPENARSFAREYDVNRVAERLEGLYKEFLPTLAWQETIAPKG